VDTWKFYDITHRDHVLCNPLSLAKVDEMVGLLDLPAGGRILDIGCGKGEMLVRIVERYGVSAVGVDLSPYVVRELRERVASRIPTADAELLEMDGAAYAGESSSFDLAGCLGASWTFGGHAGTLEALARWTRPGGQVLVGEPYWRREPDPEYLAWSGMTREQFGTHEENVRAGADLGLTPIYALASDEDDFDRYEALQWRAADRYARAHADDPDLPELLERVARGRDEYVRWGRSTLGWSLYLFRRQANG
jgi:SAM-dependent methyltransferase